MKLEVREVLRPGTALGHTAVVHASLRFALVLECSVRLKRIGWGCYLRLAASAVPVLLAGGRDDNATQITDAPGLGFAPTQMNGQPCHTVERMLGMSGTECGYGYRIFGLLFGCRAVVMRTTDTKRGRKLLAPSWLDLIQDG